MKSNVASSHLKNAARYSNNSCSYANSKRSY